MISNDERIAYLSKIGKKGLPTLAMIDSLTPFIEMSESEIGKELLADDLSQHQELINKIYNSLMQTGSAEQCDVIELKLRHARLKKTYDRLKSYYVGVQIVKKVAKNE
jgi:hypothetical protein